MAKDRFYILPGLATGSAQLAAQLNGVAPASGRFGTVGSPATDTGWISADQTVGDADNRRAEAGEASSLSAQAVRGSGTWSEAGASTTPSALTSASGIRTPTLLTKKYTAGVWTLSLPLWANTARATDGSYILRVLAARSGAGRNADGFTGYSVIASPFSASSPSGQLDTSSFKLLTVSMNLPELDLVGEYLSFALALYCAETPSVPGGGQRHIYLGQGSNSYIESTDIIERGDSVGMIVG